MSGSAAMAVAPKGGALARYEQEQLNVLRNVLCPKLNNDQLAFYAQTCQRLELDPFAKEIHCMIRKDRETDEDRLVIIVGIDGYRSRAESSDHFEGYAGTQWCGKDGVWKDVWLEDKPPAAARVGIHRKGWKEVVWGIALYAGSCQMTPIWGAQRGQIAGWKPNARWEKDPVAQLAKCAEALAHRKAFPRRVGGTNIEEELLDLDAIETTGETVAERPIAPALAQQSVKALPPPPPAAAAPAPVQSVKVEAAKPRAKESEAAASLPVGPPPPPKADTQAPVAATPTAPRSAPDPPPPVAEPEPDVAAQGTSPAPPEPKPLTLEWVEARIAEAVDEDGIVTTRLLLDRLKPEAIGDTVGRNRVARAWSARKAEVLG